MNGRQHLTIGCGVATGIALVAMKTGNTELIPAILTAPFGSKLPDIDHDRTKLGRVRKKVLSAGKVVVGLAVTAIVCFIVYTMVVLGDSALALRYLISVGVPGVIITFVLNNPRVKDFMGFAGKHRGIMHTLLVPCLLCIGMGKGLIGNLMFGCALGYISHLFADMLTIDGDPILWPVIKKCLNILHLPSDSKWLDVLSYIIAGGIVYVCFII